MKTSIMIPENGSHLKALKSYAKKSGMKLISVNSEELEDFLLGMLMDAADKEPGEKKMGDPIKFLRAHGCAI